MAGAAPHRHPAWFGAVMGTGALALVLASEASSWDLPWLETVAAAVLVLATVLAVVLLPRYLSRFRDRASLGDEIGDAAHGAMLATLPAGLIVLAVGWGRIGPSIVPESVALVVDAVLLAIGAIVAVGLGLRWSAGMMHSPTPLEGVNGGWLIPPVMNLLVPLGLTPLIVAFPEAAPLLVLVGFAFYGVGVILFLAVLPLLVGRLALRDPMPAAMAPSLWIPLAPAGVLGLSLLRLLQAADEAGVEGAGSPAVGVAVSAMGVGFGLWWAGFAALELRRIRRSGRPPVHPGWWGFVFPVAAMTLSVAAVGSATNTRAVEILGLIMALFLVGLWVLVAARTARMITARGAESLATRIPPGV